MPERSEWKTINGWQPKCPDRRDIMGRQCNACHKGWLCVRTNRLNSRLLDDMR